ncbi:MAG: DUF4293 family protein [Chitinophagaceae bacterium]|nr:MAG: DUF4293 family protein [Chitinophagaceae bacterium]
MIQRIQTVYFLIIIFLAAVLFFTPIYEIKLIGESVRAFYITDHISLLLSNIFIIGLSAINIFLFKNRPLQIKIGWFIFLLILVLSILIRLTFHTEQQNLVSDAVFIFSYFTFLPFLKLIFIFLAIKSIKKDEDLVKSADRFR